MIKTIDVSIVMGSDSDLPVMKEAARVLEELHIMYDISVVSAHRTPEYLHDHIKDMTKKGVKVFIAGAGGAAHLAGVIAAYVNIPVIAVPMKTPTLGGVDSLYSMVQMPPGIPVATVGINGSKNAGILAAQILSLGDKRLTARMSTFKQSMKDSVLRKNKKLHELGYEDYIRSMKG